MRPTLPPPGRLLAALAMLAPCACAPVPPPPSWPPNADAVLRRMHATFACSHSVQASAKIDHFGERGRVRGDVMLFAARPAQLRMDVVSPFGVALATLTSDGARFALADLREKRFYVGPASPCNLARLTGVPVPSHVLVDLLRGEAPVLRHAPEAGAMSWSPRGYWVVVIPSSREASEEIHVAPRPDDWMKPWAQQRMRVLDVRVAQRGFVHYHAELRDHEAIATAEPRTDPDNLAPPLPPSGPVCDAEIPRKIHLEVSDPDADVRFQYEQATWNPPLPEGSFEQPPPSGAQVERVTCE